MTSSVEGKCCLLKCKQSMKKQGNVVRNQCRIAKYSESIPIQQWMVDSFLAEEVTLGNSCPSIEGC